MRHDGRGRPRKRECDKVEYTYAYISITPSDKEKLRQAAIENNMSMSKLVKTSLAAMGVL